MRSSTYLTLFSTVVQLGLANPVPEVPTPTLTPICNFKYEDIEHKPEDQPPKLVSNRRIEGCSSGCELAKEDSWEVGVEISVGADLGIGLEPASAGIGVGVAYTQTKGEAYTATIGCPPGVTCMMIAINKMERVTGKQVLDAGPGDESKCRSQGKIGGDYSVLLPRTIEDDAGHTSAAVEYKGCFVKKPRKPIKDYDYEECPK